MNEKGFTPDKPRIRLLLAEDHNILRQGMARLLEQEPDLEVVGEAADGLAAVRLAMKLHPDVVLMDLGLPRLDGVEATRAIHSSLPEVRVIGLSMYEEKERAQSMMKAGASVYLTKTGTAERLIDAIRDCVKTSKTMVAGG